MNSERVPQIPLESVAIPERFRSNEHLSHIEEVIVADAYGPCGGVNHSLQIYRDVLSIVDGREKVWSNNWPVHNKLVTEDLIDLSRDELGNEMFEVFDNDWSKVPDGAIVLFSAHGVPESHLQIAKEKNCLAIDTTCKLVQFVYRRVQDAQEAGKHVVYIGALNHPEPLGVLSRANEDAMTFVQPDTPINSILLPEDKDIEVFSQTTLSTREVDELQNQLKSSYKERVEVPQRSGICYATDNRQRAARHLIEQEGANYLIVVGSQKSHNSNELRNIGDEYDHVVDSILVDRPIEIDQIGSIYDARVTKIALTAGASVEDRFTFNFEQWFQNHGVVIRRLPPTEDTTMTFKDRQTQESLSILKNRFGEAA